MSDDELFDRLRAANPYTDSAATPQRQLSDSARIKEITMQTYETPTTAVIPRTNPAAARPWWQAPALGPIAIALAAVVVVASMVASTINAPSASALVAAAALNSAEYESGHVEITVEFNEGDSFGAGSIVFSHRYDGDDSQVAIIVDEPGSDGADPVVSSTDIRFVDDVFYTRVVGVDGETQWVRSVDEEDPLGSLAMVEDLFGLNPDRANPEAVVDVLSFAEDFTEVSSEDGVTTYAATLDSQVLLDIGPDNLPAGLSLLATSDGEDLPETLDIEATVVDEELRSIVVQIVGDTELLGETDATITTKFNELGVDQGIAAPPEGQIIDADDYDPFIGVPPEMEEAMAVLAELNERRPELCAEVFAEVETMTDPEAFTPEMFNALNVEYAACLVDAGEPEAAAAVESIMPDADAN